MMEFFEYYSNERTWFIDLSKKMGCKIVDDRLSILPKNLGHGELYFSEVLPGISIVLMDVVFTTEVVFNRFKLEDDLYIIQFDISKEVNSVLVNNENEFSEIKSPLSIMNSEISIKFMPFTGKRIFVIRLIIKKNMLYEYIEKESGVVENEGIENKEFKINKLIERKFFYDTIDSKSKVLLYSVMQKSVFDFDFDLFLKGIGLKLFGNFIDSFTTVRLDETAQMNYDTILDSKNFLLANLYNQFPGVSFLAKRAGMSTSKYKFLFKTICGKTPNQFFIAEKLILARELLASQEFSSINEVMDLLQYPRNNYFSIKYFNFFKRKPRHDFIAKKEKECTENQDTLTTHYCNAFH